MASATAIIDKFGGTRATAAALDLPPSTVQSWKTSGLIPARHQKRALDAARSRGIDLSPADFFDLPEPDHSNEAAA